MTSKTNIYDNKKIKNYKYKRFRVNKDGTIKEYNQLQTYITVSNNEENDTKAYINNLTKFASKKVGELKRIEDILKTVLRYRGYNEKNLFNRISRLEQANEITLKDKKTLRKIMDRQKALAGDLTNLLEFILMMYDVYDEEIKEIKEQFGAK